MCRSNSTAIKRHLHVYKPWIALNEYGDKDGVTYRASNRLTIVTLVAIIIEHTYCFYFLYVYLLNLIWDANKPWMKFISRESIKTTTRTHMLFHNTSRSSWLNAIETRDVRQTNCSHLFVAQCFLWVCCVCSLLGSVAIDSSPINWIECTPNGLECDRADVSRRAGSTVVKNGFVGCLLSKERN